MKAKLKFNKANNTAIIHCPAAISDNVNNLLERFGYPVTVSKGVTETLFYIQFSDNADFKKFASLWKSAQQFI